MSVNALIPWLFLCENNELHPPVITKFFRCLPFGIIDSVCLHFIYVSFSLPLELLGGRTLGFRFNLDNVLLNPSLPGACSDIKVWKIAVNPTVNGLRYGMTISSNPTQELIHFYHTIPSVYVPTRSINNVCRIPLILSRVT